MPLMSFPWIFHSELGKLATGGRHELQQASIHAPGPQKQRHNARLDTNVELGLVETDEGITRFGEVLNLDFGRTQGIATADERQYDNPREEKDKGTEL